MSAAIIGSLRPIAPSLLTYAEISRVQPLHSYLKSNTDTPLYLGGSYWLCWPYKIYALWKGENIGVITDRSQFDPASKQEELNLNNSITLGQEFYYACLSEKDSSSECQKDINHRIDQLTGKSREWGSEVVNKGAFRINGESYIYIMRYAKHGHKA
jgi:hypothetical protein